jgi:lipid-A-disaccharide synthase-like uncharacterized protein
MSNWTIWVAIGFLGQALFTARFAVQWVVSERKRDSVVPPAFWWLSLAGGSVLLAYVIHRRDPVLIVGQVMGVFIYIRNLMLVAKGKRRAAKRSSRDPASKPDSGATPHRARPHKHRRSNKTHATGPEIRGLEERIP